MLLYKYLYIARYDLLFTTKKKKKKLFSHVEGKRYSTICSSFFSFPFHEYIYISVDFCWGREDKKIHSKIREIGRASLFKRYHFSLPDAKIFVLAFEIVTTASTEQ